MHVFASTGEISHCLNAGGMGRQDYETETLITHSLTGEGFDASEDGTGRGTPLVPVLPKPSDPCHPLAAGAHPPAIAFDCKATQASEGEIAPTLRAMTHSGSHQNGGGQIAVAFSATDYKSGAFEEVDVARAITTSADRTRAAPIAFQERGRDGGRNLEIGGDLAYALTAPKDGGRSQEKNIAHGMQVRRLTPTECERLQGFPDGYTLVPHRGKPAADGPRYKALGNSWAVPCVRWIGERIAAVDAIELRAAA